MTVICESYIVKINQLHGALALESPNCEDFTRGVGILGLFTKVYDCVILWIYSMYVPCICTHNTLL